MQKFILSILMFTFAMSCNAVQPNPKLTPGELCTPNNPDFVGYRYSAHVAYCKRNVTHDEKLQVAQNYGIPESEWGNYEFDHLIPLNSGGDSSIANIWPQPLAEAHEKDAVEQAAFDGLSNGTLTQAQAIQMEWDFINKH